MRASYLSQDRCELQFAVKELARRMQQPNATNMQALKRLVRFLKGRPRFLVVYVRQAEEQVVDVFSDSDWAGCANTRRSTSSSYVKLASLCSVSHNSKCGGDKFPRALREQGGEAMCTSGRHGVEGDSLTTQSGEKETSPHPSLMGARGRWPAES